jgi:hypothetical protein
MSRLLLGLLVNSLLMTAVSHAQEERQLGWKKTANLGLNLSLSSSQDVIGQTDGTSEAYGLNVKTSFVRVRERNEWKTDAAMVESTTRTPSVPRFVKSSDELKLATMFVHYWNGNPDFGPYARAEVASPVFKGEDVQAAPKTYRITHRDQSEDVVTGTSLRLTDGFKPLTTKESVGWLWRPKNEPNIKIETRLGAAAMQISADGQLAVKGANAAGELQVNELKDINQLGVEAAVSIKGKVDEKSGYEAGVETLTPFVSDKDAGDDRDAFRLTNVDGYVKLTSNITTWASFAYDYKVKLQPQLVDRAQQIHLIVLTINYNVL